MLLSKPTKIALALTVGLSSAAAVAQVTENTQATLTISSSFTLTETAPISFGTIRANVTKTADTGDGSNATMTAGAGVTIPGDGSAALETTTQGLDATPCNGGNDDCVLTTEATIISAGSRGEYAITGAAPNSTLRVVDPDDIELTATGVNATSKFDLAIDLSDMVVIGGPNDGQTVSATNVTTDGTGAVSIGVGGRLTIDPLASQLDEGAYSGTYNIVVSY